MAFTDLTYYVGDIRISKNVYLEEDLNLYITNVQKDVLIKLLGYALYKSFIDGLDIDFASQVGTISVSGTAVTGIGTSFTSLVARGDINSSTLGTKVVESITDDTNLVLTESGATLSGESYTYRKILDKWLDFRDGKLFQVTNRDGNPVYVKWEGLINSQKVSLLSYFVWYYYNVDAQSVNTSVGQVNMNGENSVRTPINQLNHKLISNYNKGADLYGKDMEYLTGKDAILRGRRYKQKFDIVKATLYYYEEAIKGTASNYIYQMNDQNGDDYYPDWQFTEIKKLNTFGI